MAKHNLTSCRVPRLSRVKPRGAAYLVPLLVVSAFMFVGCDTVAGIEMFMCNFQPDPVHCKQDASIQAGQASDCDHIGQKAEFKDAGSNPPQDKCYMMVAANTQDPSVCDRIKGGIGSYTKEECLDGIAKTATEPETCGKLSGQAATDCVNNVTTNLQAEIQAESAKPKPDQAKLDELQQKMDRTGEFFETMTNLQKTQTDMENAAIKNLR